MFVNKGKINTPRLPMLHQKESPEKPQYNMATPLPHFALPLPPTFSRKNFQNS